MEFLLVTIFYFNLITLLLIGDEKTMTEDEINSKKTVTNVDFKDKKLFNNLENGGLVDKDILLY